jgi:hypothetical protein
MFKIGDRIRSYDFEDRSHDSYWVGVIQEESDKGWICTVVARKVNGRDIDLAQLPATFGAPKPFDSHGIKVSFVELEETPVVEAPQVEDPTPAVKAKASTKKKS